MRLLNIIKASVTEIDQIGSSESTGIPGVNRSYKITLDDNTSWVMKKKEDEHTSRWRYIPPYSQYLRERSGYLTDKQLGFDLVPTTKIIKFKGDLASIQSWVEEGLPSDTTLNTYSDDDVWKMGLFDLIIGNTDRHSGNFLTLNGRPVAIDQGYAFPNKAQIDDPKSVILSRFAYSVWDKPIPDKYLSSIENLKQLEFQKEMSYLLDDSSLKLFNERVDALLDKKVASFPKYRVVKKIKGIPGK